MNTYSGRENLLRGNRTYKVGKKRKFIEVKLRTCQGERKKEGKQFSFS